MVLIFFGVIPSFAIYLLLYLKKSTSPLVVFLCGIGLIFVSVVTLFKLGDISEMARVYLNPTGYKQVMTESRLALYVLPFLSAGVGSNLISHVLLQHLRRTEQIYRDEIQVKNRENA